MTRRMLGMLLSLVLAFAALGCGTVKAETLDINGLKIRPGMTAFSTNKGTQEPRYTAEQVAGPLTEYCPNLLALDLGHNDIHDLTFLKAWPKLRRLIVVDSKTRLTDISPLKDLNDLEYVELFLQNITDISALAGKTNLIDLNLAHNDIRDLTPLHSCTKLKRLWISYNYHLPQSEIDAFKKAVPDCQVVINEWNSTGRGWRETKNGPVPHYRILRESFLTGNYIPFEDSAPLEPETPAAGADSGKTAEGAEEIKAADGAAPESGAAAGTPENVGETAESAETGMETAEAPEKGVETAEAPGTGGEAAPEKTAESGEEVAGTAAAAVTAEKKTACEPMLRNGGSFVYLVQEDGTILGWGDNRMGELGTTPTKILTKPQRAADGMNGTELADLQCGNENALFLKKDGTVWTCGTYSRGTQGLGKVNSIVKTPTQIPGLKNIVQISCGFGHNAVLDAEGHVWTWGRNDRGQLGLGDTNGRNQPERVALEGIVAVNCGGKFTLAQDRDGNLWGWGSNEYQVLAPGKKQAYATPLKLDGFEGKNIVSFSAGSDVAFWLDDGGTLWTRGRNELKQLGSSAGEWKASPNLTTVDIPEKVKTVCAYSAATAALTESGNVYIWGSVSAGQLGNGKNVTGTLPVLVWDRGDAVEIAMGSLISSLRTEDGKIYLTGYNKYGQLGNGTTRSSYSWIWNGATVSAAP